MIQEREEDLITDAVMIQESAHARTMSTHARTMSTHARTRSAHVRTKSAHVRTKSAHARTKSDPEVPKEFQLLPL
jgi:hypothetical protein